MIVKVPLKVALLDHLHSVYKRRPKKWVSGTELEDLSGRLGFKPSNGARRMRELARSGMVKRELINGFVQYKYR